MDRLSFKACLGCLLFAVAAGAGGRPVAPLLRPVAKLTGGAAGDQFGVSVLSCDLNRDGYPETVVGARDADPGGLADAGSVYVYSGKDRRLLKRLDGRVAGGIFGYALACCDVNRDRFPDLIVGAPNQDGGKVYVYTGPDLSFLVQFDRPQGTGQFGFALACGDVNKDRHPDIVVGAPNQGHEGSGAGAAIVYSGKNASLIKRLNGRNFGDSFGQSVATCDLDRDGRMDVVAGSPLGDPEGRVDAGIVAVYSGKDWSSLRRFDGEAPGDLFGNAVACCDVDRDRFPDLAIAAPLADPEAVQDAGSVILYSGKRGALLRRFNGPAPDFTLGTAVTCCNLNRDAWPEIVIGASDIRVQGSAIIGGVVIFSTRTGALVQRLDGETDGDRFGESIACGDGTGRRSSRLVVGARQAGGGAGAAYVYAVRRGR